MSSYKTLFIVMLLIPCTCLVLESQEDADRTNQTGAKVPEQAITDYESNVTALISIINQYNNIDDLREVDEENGVLVVEKACKALGKYRAPKAVKPLLELCNGEIGGRWQRGSKLMWEPVLTDDAVRIRELMPAPYVALIDIGMPAVPSLVETVALNSVVLIGKAHSITGYRSLSHNGYYAYWCLLAITGREGATLHLRAAMEEEDDPTKRQHLQEALALTARLTELKTEGPL